MEIKRIGVWYFLGMMVITTLVSLFFLTPSPVSAYTMSINTSIDAAVDITPSDDSSSSARITNDEVEIVTNCKAGYNLTLSSSVNDNNLYLDGDSSNNTSGTYFAPSNGSTALNNAPNTWGYYFSSYSRGQTPTVPTTTSVFSPVPTLNSTPAILKTTAQTASSTDIDDTLNVYLGVNMDNGMTPGSYKMIPESNQNNAPNGSLVYYLTMDGGCRNYTVSFNPNGGTGTMDPQDITVGEATNLVPNSYTAPALGESYQNAAGTTIPATAGKMWTFWGWNTAIDGSGDWYKDRESVTDLVASGSIITLYAQWKQATLADLIPDPNPSPSNPKTIDHDTMQDMSAAACWNSEKFVAIGTPYGQITLKDTRDGNNRTYTVAKLPDGLCWMTQNLNLGTSTPITLTANDTDLEEGATFTLPASDPNDFATSGSAQVIYNKATVLNNMTVPDYTVNGTTYTGKVNAYYSYAAATADTSTYSKSTDKMEIATSICPKNWDLPVSRQYENLRAKGSITTYNTSGASYEGKNAGNEPYYFIYGGYRKAAGNAVNTTYFTNPTSYGYLWIANNSNTAYGRYIAIYSGGINNSTTNGMFGGNLYKYYGLSIRCVASMNEASYTITYTNTDTSDTQTQGIVMGESVLIRPTIDWTKTGYRLMGWDTNSSATNVVYTTGQSITPSSDMTLYTVWRPSYTLQYDGNGADAGVMTNVKHTNVTAGDVFDLFASNYSKANYGFAGWSFDQNAQPGGASKIYGPNEAIEAPAPSTPGETKTLYAVWVPAETGVYMQTWNGCDNLNTGDVIALKDQRDTNTYTVGKLADGNCWMMENLRLDTAGSSDSTKSQGFAGAFVGLADPETANFSNSTTANTLNGNTLYSTTNITGSNQGYRFPRYNNANTANRSTGPTADDNRATATIAHGSNLSAATYSYGNYYTWTAALANTNDYTSPTATVDGKTSETAGTSICPTGWKLPYGRNTGNGTTSGGFYYLGTQLGATSNNEASSRVWRGYPNNFIYSGYFSTSSVNSRGSGGFYWSSTANSGTYAYQMNMTYNSTSPGSSYNNNKHRGYSARCIKLSSAQVTLNGNGATTAGSATTTVAIDDTTLGAITNPSRAYTVSGWTVPSGNNADGATVNDGVTPGTITSNYTFNGWYKEAAATNLIASNATTPILQANTDYTDASGRWNHSGSVVLFAGWSGQSITLPTITKQGYTCGWTTASTGATIIQYESGASLVPAADIILYGVCKANPYVIDFNANGGTGLMAMQEIDRDESVKLIANSFSAPSGNSYMDANNNVVSGVADKLWVFWGWNTEIDGTGDWYKDKESVINLTISGDIITLYAQWKQAVLEDMTIPTTGTKTITHEAMQDMNGAICWNSDITTKAALEAANKTGAVTLVDNRDGIARSYDVSKLPDGLCWMTTNLALGTTVQITLTSEDTDLEDGTTFNLPASSSSFADDTNYNTTPQIFNGSSNDGYHYGEYYGGYYSWAAAIASVDSFNRSSQNVETSICPYNWDLPTNTQYNALASAGSLTDYSTASDLPYNFTYGGYLSGSSIYSRTSRGDLWSSTTASTEYTTMAIFRRINAEGFSSIRNYKYQGRSVRCVANMNEASYKVTLVNTDTGETKTKIGNIIGQNGTVKLSTTWSKPNYAIAGWDTNSEGVNVVYDNNESINLSSNMTLYTVWRPSYTLQYDGNGADAGVMTNVKHTNVTAGDVFDLFASNYSKANYGFAGWSFDQNAQPGGASRIYGPNEAITAPAPTTPGETKYLYAVWVPAETGVYMQTWSGCTSMAFGSMIALRDQRDNQVYTVAKLADGNCWMVENLRLENQHTVGYNINDPSITNESLAEGYDGVFAGLADPEDIPNTSSSIPPNSLYTTDTTSTTLNIITGDNLAHRFPRYDNSNTSARAVNPSATDNRATSSSTHHYLYEDIYSLGNQYNWAAALANTNDYTFPTATVDGKTSETAGTSICPTGWKLPYGRNTGNGTTSGGFYYLGTQLGATSSSEASSRIWRSYPSNFVIGRGMSFYWTSTSGSSSAAYILSLNHDSVKTNVEANKYQGFSIRCVNLVNASVALNSNGATNAGSAATTVSIGDAVLGSITNPSRSYSLSGWDTTNNNASGAIVNGGIDPGTITSDYTFNGWYKEAAATNLIASNATTPILQANTDYTDASGRWNHSGSVVLFAGWSGQAVTLPTITKSGYTCGWTAISSGATSIQYDSGAAYIPDSTKTLYGVCTKDCPEGKICYKANGGNVEGTMGKQTVASNATEVALIASNYSRANYGFAGWNTAADGSGTNYGPNETIDDATVLANIQSDGLILYAKWIASAGNLQSWNGCSSLTSGAVTALKDTRDNQVYAVAKLVDGNCWMIENLRLDTAGSSDSAKAQGFGGVFAGLADPESIIPPSNATAANSLYYSGTQSGTATRNIGTANGPAYRFPRYKNSNTSDRATEPAYGATNIYSYGNEYTWAAAIADTTAYTSSNSHTNVATSICPKGWHLPYGNTGTSGNNRGGASGGFSYLDKRLGGTGDSVSGNSGKARIKEWKKYPNNFLYNDNANPVTGYYWSATASDSASAYHLRVDGYFSPGSIAGEKSRTMRVRCLIGT